MLEECSLNLLGRFLTNRSFNQRAAKALLRSVWKMGQIFVLLMLEMVYFNLNFPWRAS